MRDRYEDEYDVAEEDRPPSWRARMGERLSVWIGAVLALTIVCGAGLWGYRLTQREAMAIPVIRAAQTEVKVAPADDGVPDTQQTRIESYNAGSGTGEAQPPRIAFAPPPERPAAEDVPMGRLTGEETAEAASAPVPLTVSAGGDATALAPMVSRPAPPRPADLIQRALQARTAASAEEELALRAAASPVQIQLGDYGTREETEAEWERIFGANDDILQGRALVVQTTISGGRRRFRLRAGPFKDQIEARAVCRALTARGQDCLVAVNG